jgi:hypothetical protein
MAATTLKTSQRWLLTDMSQVVACLSIQQKSRQAQKRLCRRAYRAVRTILGKIEQLEHYSINAKNCPGFSQLFIRFYFKLKYST